MSADAEYKAWSIRQAHYQHFIDREYVTIIKVTPRLWPAFSLVYNGLAEEWYLQRSMNLMTSLRLK